LEHPWEPSTARAHVTLLTSGGDLLEEADADRAARRCLEALGDVVAFRQQVRPTFLEWHFLPRALRRVLTASSADVHAEVLDFVLEHAPRAHADLRGDLAVLVVNIRNSVVTAEAEQVRDFALDRDGSLSATLLRKLAADGDHDAGNELGRRAESGDLNAASAIGRADKLSEPAAQALLNDTVTDCRKIIADAAAGAYSDGKDSARNLVVLNLAFPGLADWETVFDLLGDRRVAADAKLGAVTVLTDADSIPDNALTSIRERMIADGPQAIGSILSLTTDPEVYQGQTYAFAVAVGAIGNDRTIQRVLSLLRGSTTQRRSACTVITALSRRAADPLIQGALIMLTADPQHEVRAAAASALLRGVVPGVSAEVEQALLAAACESGCAVPLQVARVLAATPDGVRKREILTGLLAAHRSALVRRAVALSSE
jgi:hypothetical protein